MRAGYLCITSLLRLSSPPSYLSPSPSPIAISLLMIWDDPLVFFHSYALYLSAHQIVRKCILIHWSGPTEVPWSVSYPIHDHPSPGYQCVQAGCRCCLSRIKQAGAALRVQPGESFMGGNYYYMTSAAATTTVVTTTFLATLD